MGEGSKKKEKEKDKGKKKAEDAAAYEEALRDCKISWLSKLGSQELYSELLKAGGESSVITSIHAARLANMLAVETAERKWKDIGTGRRCHPVGRSAGPPCLAWHEGRHQGQRWRVEEGDGESEGATDGGLISQG